MAHAIGNNENHHTPQPIHLAIIGGGIGGLALLLGILQHTSPSIIRAHLYESATAFSEIGAGVGFGPNSVRAMRMVSPKLQEAYARIAAKPDIEIIDGKEKVRWHRMVMGMDGRGSNTLKAGDEIAVVYNENRMKSAHRATFLEEMIKLLPGGTGEGYVTFKKRCVDIEDLGEGKGVRVHFADGTRTEASAVIGCDGVKSRVRQIILKGQDNVEPRFTGKYAYRGLIPMEDAVAAMGPGARISHMDWGYGGHLVCFPIDKGTTLNVVAFYTKKDGKWDHGSDWVVPGTVAQCLEDYKDWSQPVRDLLANLKKPDIWAIFEHPPANIYYSGSKICGLGDAMHASSPHNGAGAGMCIEDAAVMCTLLGKLSSPDPTFLEKVFHAFDTVRRPRTQRLVTHSRDAGLLYDFQKEGILDDPEKLKAEIEQRLLWIWNIDLEEHCREAIEIMQN